MNVTIGYVEVDEASVPLANRRAASAALTFARRDLDLPPIPVRWFDVAPPGVPARWTRGAVNGLCTDLAGDVGIWIRRGARTTTFDRDPVALILDPMTPVATARAVLHEARHARAVLDGVPKGTTSELAALAYEERHRKLAARMGSPGWP